MFTGVQIREVRTSLGMTAEQFAGLVGVHQASLYRWEAKGENVRLDPLQSRLQIVIRDVLGRQRPEEALSWAELAADLVIRGGLFALYRQPAACSRGHAM